MRSRYTANVLGARAYLLLSWHPDSRPRQLQIDPSMHWLGLKIRHTEQGQPGDLHGIVEFVARYKVHGRGHRLHELSRFQKVDQRWVYVDGETV